MLDNIKELKIREDKNFFEFKRGFLKLHNGEYAISSNGTSWVSIPKEHGRNIKFAWHSQKNAHKSQESTRARRFVQMNCRKTAFFVSGEMSLSEAIDNPQDPHGTRLLMHDVDEIVHNGGEAIINIDHYQAIKNTLDENPESLPVIIHVFAFEEKDTIQMELMLSMLDKDLSIKDLSKSLYAYHTFIVEGKDEETGEYTCVHKHAAGFEPIEIISLKDVLKVVDFQSSLDTKDHTRIPFSFIKTLL